MLRLPLAAEQVFRFHADVNNLPRLTPGPARILQAAVPSSEGDLQLIEFGRRPLAMRWAARIVRFDPPRTVIDVQERGPFRLWRHTHSVRPDGAGSVLVDRVDFRFFPGTIGRHADTLLLRPILRLLFSERHRRSRALLAREMRDGHAPPL
jgi:hypothetical protein